MIVGPPWFCPVGREEDTLRAEGGGRRAEGLGVRGIKTCLGGWKAAFFNHRGHRAPEAGEGSCGALPNEMEGALRVGTFGLRVWGRRAMIYLSSNEGEVFGPLAWVIGRASRLIREGRGLEFRHPKGCSSEKHPVRSLSEPESVSSRAGGRGLSSTTDP